MTGERRRDTDVLRARRKLTALRRAEFRLRQRLDAIDFELDVLTPELEELETLAAIGQLPEFTVEDDES
jgi:hypothetical protein